jgi:hypothetical protein
VDDARQGTALLLAMLGALLGTLITLLLDTTPTVRAIGAILGALIPTLVGHVGPWRYPRAAVGVGVTLVALGMTYGGFTIFDYAADKEETFPIPSGMPAPNPPPPPPPGPPADNGEHITTTDDGLSMKVSPDRVHCDSDECDNDVTVTSTGNELLEITSIEFEGEAAEEFGYSGNCEEQSPLGKDESCGIQISFKPSGGGGTRNVNLVIHQNFVGAPTRVPVAGEVEGGGPPPPPPPSLGDLVALRSGVSCSHVRGGALVNGEPRDAIQISFSLRFLDAPDGPQSVFVSARSTLGPTGQSQGRREGSRDVALALRSIDYGRRHLVIVRIDPNNDVPESNDHNNLLRVRVDLPAAPGSPQPLSCRAG